jgi:hypothetical protein
MIAAWFVILTAFVFLGFSFFAVNLSNTHEHRRHLQVQVDDGALAAGGFFTGCFQNPGAANANIAREARRFSGDPTYPTNYFSGGSYDTAKFPGPFNQQVENASRVAVGLNKATYPPYASPITEFDPTFDLRPDLAGIQNLPCDASVLDVKATDVDVPTPFGGLVPTASNDVDVKARARVEIKKVQVFSGFLPWAVPEVKPKAVLAIFVDENNGAVRGVQSLVSQSNTETLNGVPNAVWEADAQFTGHGQAGTGVIIAISTSATPQTSGTLAEICGQAPVKCYSGSGATSGLWYIQGFTNGNGTLAAPQLGSVTLQNASCGDDSAPYYLLNGDCTVQVTAHVDFGVAGDPRLFPNCARVNVNGSPMAWSSGTTWTGTVSIANATGRNIVSLDWDSGIGNNSSSCPNNRPNNGSFDKVAAPYAANDASGPINYLGVSAGGAFVGAIGTSANSPNTVHVKVGLEPPLRVATDPNEPPIILRLGSTTGSRTQALVCDHAPVVLEDAVRDGCKTHYSVNTRGEVCTGGNPPGPTWNVSNLPPALPPPQPNPAPDCIQWKTGQVTSMAKGLHDRFEAPFASSGGCPPNLWKSYRTSNPPELPPPTDPRWVSLVVADATKFVGQGNGVIPIRVFAGFYVTGWFVSGGGQGTQGCGPGVNDPHPLGYNPSSQKASGDVWGYFVTNVILGNDTDSTEFCQFNEVGLCFARLTQ